MYITFFERVSWLQSRLLHCSLKPCSNPFETCMPPFFNRIDSIGKCNILQQKKYTCQFQYQSTACFCLGFLYIKMQDYFKYLLHAPLVGVCNLYKWEMKWMKVNKKHIYIYIQWKISLNFWIKYPSKILRKNKAQHTRFPGNFDWILYVKDFIP